MKEAPETCAHATSHKKPGGADYGGGRAARRNTWVVTEVAGSAIRLLSQLSAVLTVGMAHRQFSDASTSVTKPKLYPFQKLRSRISMHRPEVLLRRNQLCATRGRVQLYRMKLGDSSLESPVSRLQLSVSATS